MKRFDKRLNERRKYYSATKLKVETETRTWYKYSLHYIKDNNF